MIDVADRLAIDDVLARYGWAFDQGDGAAYAALFAEDGVLTGFGEPFRGRAALAALAEGTLAQSRGKWRHHLTNVLFRYVAGEDGARGKDRVEAKGYQLVTNWSQAPAAFHMMLEPRWTLRRRDEGWEIESLDLQFVGPDA
jgi:uncharacterized protein (TIGR02246 family)